MMSFLGILLNSKKIHSPVNFAKYFSDSEQPFYRDHKGEHLEITTEAYSEPCQTSILKYLNNEQVHMKLNGKQLYLFCLSFISK